MSTKKEAEVTNTVATAYRNNPNHFAAWQEILHNNLFGKLEIDLTLTHKEV
jgi:hypothetical protein